MSGKDDQIGDAAARWFAAQQTGAADATAFATWRDADPVHAIAYLRLAGTWQRLAVEDGCRDDAVAAASRRSVLRRLAIGGLAGAAGLGLFATHTAAWATAQTATGERRLERLPDGSIAALSSDTRMRWQCDAANRSLKVERGEILLTVRPGLPFAVSCGAQRMMLTTGRYAVALRDTGAAKLVVIEGHATVRQGRAMLNVFANDDRVSVSSGHMLEALPDGNIAIEAVSARRIEEDTAWLRGEVVFNGTSLAQAVASFNRYLREKLVLSRPEMGHLRVDGRFRLDDPATFLLALQSGFDITVTPVDERLILSRKNI